MSDDLLYARDVCIAIHDGLDPEQEEWRRAWYVSQISQLETAMEILYCQGRAKGWLNFLRRYGVEID